MLRHVALGLLALLPALLPGAVHALPTPNGTHLQGTHLQGGCLQGTHLQGTHLQGTHLQGTHLQGTHLQGGSVQGTHLQGTQVQGTHLQGTQVQETHLQGGSVQGRSFQGAAMPDAWTAKGRLVGWKRDPQRTGPTPVRLETRERPRRRAPARDSGQLIHAGSRPRASHAHEWGRVTR